MPSSTGLTRRGLKNKETYTATHAPSHCCKTYQQAHRRKTYEEASGAANKKANKEADELMGHHIVVAPNFNFDKQYYFSLLHLSMTLKNTLAVDVVLVVVL